MTKEHAAALSRQLLDQQFKKWPKRSARNVPPRGWIRTLREALGMSTEQLAKRLKLVQSTMTGIEKSEIKGTIQIATLKRVAEALNAELVYAIVPREPLDIIVARQRLNKAGQLRFESLKQRNLQSPVYREVLKVCEKKIPLREVWEESEDRGRKTE